MAFGCQFSVEGQQEKHFPSNKKRRKEWEDASGRIKLPKDPLLFLSTLALMSLSLLVDHSYWQSLQTAETRNFRCHLLGWKRRERSFLSTDLTLYQRRLNALWGGGIHGTAFGLNLYLYPSPPVSSFGCCGHHISILFYQLCRGKNSNR